MKTKALTAAQIDTLAQRLSDTPIEPSASAKTAGDAFARMLAARIGAERAALAFTSIMTAESCDQAEARLTLVLDYGNPDLAGEPIKAAVEELTAAPAQVIGKRQAIRDQAQSGALPQPPDFSKATHARFRAKLVQIVAMAEEGDIAALQVFEINPVSSSPKAMARYRDLCVIAITARAKITA
jgi:imidazolonepropionase-like amidohydrolase